MQFYLIGAVVIAEILRSFLCCGKLEKMSAPNMAKSIDHALLPPDLTFQEVSTGCELARKYQVFSVCMKPSHIEQGTKRSKKEELLKNKAPVPAKLAGEPETTT